MEQEAVNSTSKIFKEIEFAQGIAIPLLYQYKMLDMKDQAILAKQTADEYHNFDPLTLIMEKS